MSRKFKIGLALILVAWFVGLLFYYLHNANFAVLEPKGTIADKQRSLIIFASLLSLVVVVPVYVMTAYISLKYSENNHKKSRKPVKYAPEWDRNRWIEGIWWGIPLTLILILSVVTWKSSHDLDPFRSISAAAKPMTVQVVALQWKWLFIYPEQNVASVNYLELPVNRPVKFEITSDAPMNSFWIPNLGGQVYAMSGMSTNLNLMATKTGDYPGMSANISGVGFADMKFTVRVGSDADVSRWVSSIRQQSRNLNSTEYKRLAEPAVTSEPVYYSSVEHDLYNKVVMKYMGPENEEGMTHSHTD